MILFSFVALCCTKSNFGRSKIVIKGETINYYMFVLIILYDTPKIIESLEVVSLHCVISYFCWGWIEIDFYFGMGGGGGIEMKKIYL